jgi:hypothetical protein
MGDAQVVHSSPTSFTDRECKEGTYERVKVWKKSTPRKYSIHRIFFDRWLRSVLGGARNFAHYALFFAQKTTPALWGSECDRCYRQLSACVTIQARQRGQLAN